MCLVRSQRRWHRAPWGKAKREGWVGSLPRAPTRYTVSLSLLWMQGLKLLPPLLNHHPSLCNFCSDLASKDQKTFVFFPSPLLVSLKLIKPNLSCVAYLSQGWLGEVGVGGRMECGQGLWGPLPGLHVSGPFIAGGETAEVTAKAEALAAQPSKLRCNQLAERGRRPAASCVRDNGKLSGCLSKSCICVLVHTWVLSSLGGGAWGSISAAPWHAAGAPALLGWDRMAKSDSWPRR